jgi:23S rRNA pseudouridine1911/1915/1917 synthase
VHRLDKETSGLILVAKNIKGARELTELFKKGLVKKIYSALVHGIFKEKAGIIEAPLLYQQDNTKKVIVSPNGKPAQTYYKVIEENGPFSLLSLEPQTGRMHQIRVHLAHIQHPILGDAKYGTARLDWQKYPKIPKRLYLHAEQLLLPKQILETPLLCETPKVFYQTLKAVAPYALDG